MSYIKCERNKINTSCKFSQNPYSDCYHVQLVSQNVMSATLVGVSNARSHMLLVSLKMKALKQGNDRLKMSTTY